MKISIIPILATIVPVLCCCSKAAAPDYVANQAIQFTVSDENATKGEIVKIDNLNAFKVTALSSTENYFTALEVTSSDKGVTWNTASQYFWPGYDLRFYAYSNENGTVSITNQEQKISNYTVTTDISDQKDFVVAYNTGNFEKNSEKGVNMPFQHATSGLVVKASADNENYVINVYGVKVANLRGTDTFIFPAGDVTGSCWAGYSNAKHDPSTTIVDYKVVYKTPVTLAQTAKNISGETTNFFILPQQREKWKATSAATNTAENQGAYISLLVNISTKNGINVYPKSSSYVMEGVNAAWDAVGVDFKMEPGKIYTYTLNFFGENGGGQQDPDDPEDDGKGGDPVLKGSMSYNVTVEDWIVGGSYDIKMQ